MKADFFKLMITDLFCISLDAEEFHFLEEIVDDRVLDPLTIGTESLDKIWFFTTRIEAERNLASVNREDWPGAHIIHFGRK